MIIDGNVHGTSKFFQISLFISDFIYVRPDRAPNIGRAFEIWLYRDTVIAIMHLYLNAEEHELPETGEWKMVHMLDNGKYLAVTK